MGAVDFMTIARGRTAQDAFNSAVREARYEHGHGGYTGTIAEKHEFTMISTSRKLDKKAAVEYARDLINIRDPRVDDKWGPAGCINIGNGEFLFFGLASS